MNPLQAYSLKSPNTIKRLKSLIYKIYLQFYNNRLSLIMIIIRNWMVENV